jgi:hypothetical protein
MSTNPYQPPKSKVEDIQAASKLRYTPGQQYRGSAKLMRLAAWCELLSVPALLLAIGISFAATANPSLKFVESIETLFTTPMSLIALFALSLLFTERSQYRGANWAILAQAISTIAYACWIIPSGFLGWESNTTFDLAYLLVVGSIMLWLGICILRNPDPLWGYQRHYALSTIYAGVLIMTIVLAVFALIPLIWNLVLGYKVFSRAANELEQTPPVEPAGAQP